MGSRDRLLLFLCFYKVVPGGVTGCICRMQSMRGPIGVVFEEREVILIFLLRTYSRLVILWLRFQHLEIERYYVWTRPSHAFSGGISGLKPLPLKLLPDISRELMVERCLSRLRDPKSIIGVSHLSLRLLNRPSIYGGDRILPAGRVIVILKDEYIAYVVNVFYYFRSCTTVFNAERRIGSRLSHALHVLLHIGGIWTIIVEIA